MKCPCCSNLLYDACCGRIHAGSLAPTPSKLMRARYSAYAVGKVDFIIETTHHLNSSYEENKELWRASLIKWCKGTQFKKLEVDHIEESEESQEGYVTFRAFLRMGNKSYILHEKSYFLKTDAGWLYRSGEHLL